MSTYRSQCSEQTAGRTIRYSNPDKDTRIFNSPKRQDFTLVQTAIIAGGKATGAQI